MKHFRIWFICGRVCLHDADRYAEVGGCVTFYRGSQSAPSACHVMAIVDRIEESATPYPANPCPVAVNHVRPPVPG